MSEARYCLRADVVAVPRIAQWYAWTYLMSPATAALYLANRYVRIMESYLDAPELHAQALANAAMRGGPFMDWPAARADEIAALLAHTRARHAPQLAFAAALGRCWEQLAQHAHGYALADLYAELPQEVRGLVELVYTLGGAPDLRVIEPLLYHCALYDPGAQSALVYRLDGDRRPFALSTPQMMRPDAVLLEFPFASPVHDFLANLRDSPQPWDAIVAGLHLRGEQRERFRALVALQEPQAAPRPRVAARLETCRWRYFGHACVLLETPCGKSVLVDPVIAYDTAATPPRFTLADLPPRIDYVLLTHNHQDHVLLETLLALRPRIAHILVPAGGGSLADPSLKLALRAAGFDNVVELGALDSVADGALRMTALPFLGEHADLDIRTKAAWLVEAAGTRLLFAADSNNLEPQLYARLKPLIGHLHALFIGMECEGAPLSWLYGPLLPAPLEHAKDQSRRLNGSDYRRAFNLLRSLDCEQVFVYALGLEPWLSFISSIEPDPNSAAMRSVRALISACDELGIPAERLYGKAES
ncbi:L-ascorbate metabolism protein UlaG (beta-lactamase superfamily) [Oxalobacteraceae bacterium GrIS 1.11]